MLREAGAPLKVAGIDFSSLAIDVVLVDLDDIEPPQWMRFPLAGQDAFDRTRSVSAAMPSSSFWEDTLAIGIEHPAGKFGTGSMMRVQGAVLACLPAGVLVQPWPPSAWRKAVGLAGNASKDDIARFATSSRGPLGTLVTEGYDRRTATTFRTYTGATPSQWPQDACDAYCIALATMRALSSEAAA